MLEGQSSGWAGSDGANVWEEAVLVSHGWRGLPLVGVYL
eukprot:COSAG04_NODE_12871_length_631_cov_0.718045_1_plen_38_part_10